MFSSMYYDFPANKCRYVHIYVVEHTNIFAYIGKKSYLCSVISKARREYPRNLGTRYPRGVGTLTL